MDHQKLASLTSDYHTMGRNALGIVGHYYPDVLPHAKKLMDAGLPYVQKADAALPALRGGYRVGKGVRAGIKQVAPNAHRAIEGAVQAGANAFRRADEHLTHKLMGAKKASLNAYSVYLEMQKEAASSLWINPERSIKLQAKLLERRKARALSAGFPTLDFHQTPQPASFLASKLPGRAAGLLGPLAQKADRALAPHIQERWQEISGRFNHIGAHMQETAPWLHRLGLRGAVVLPKSESLRHVSPELRNASTDHAARLIPAEHELDEAAYTARARMHPQQFSGDGYTHSYRGIGKRLIAHADPGVILAESNLTGASMDPVSAQANASLRTRSTDRIRMTMPFGKVIPVDGREWRSQQRVMATRKRNTLTDGVRDMLHSELMGTLTNDETGRVRLSKVPQRALMSGLTATNDALVHHSPDMRAHEYLDIKRKKKEFGQSLAAMLQKDPNMRDTMFRTSEPVMAPTYDVHGNATAYDQPGGPVRVARPPGATSFQRRGAEI